jgi:hypothetical protein
MRTAKSCGPDVERFFVLVENSKNPFQLRASVDWRPPFPLRSPGGLYGLPAASTLPPDAHAGVATVDTGKQPALPPTNRSTLSRGTATTAGLAMRRPDTDLS